jgi:protein-L-isoaspartate O-methyltransferase
LASEYALDTTKGLHQEAKRRHRELSVDEVRARVGDGRAQEAKTLF